MLLMGTTIMLIGHDWPAVWPLVGAILGAITGCFLSCAAVRLPLRQSLHKPAHSRCDTCQTRLTIPDLIPLFSWLFLRGRCRHCGIAYGVHNFLWELAFTSLGALFGYLAEPGYYTPSIIALGLLGICLLTCAILLPSRR